MTEASTEARAAGMNRPLLNGGLVLLALGGVMCMAGGLRPRRPWWARPAAGCGSGTSRRARRRAVATPRHAPAAVAGAQGWRQNSH